MEQYVTGVVELRVDGGEQRIVPAIGDQLAGALDYRGLTDGQHTLSVVAVTGGGRELQVLIETPEGRAVMLVDRKNGKVLGTLRFVPGVAPGAP